MSRFLLILFALIISFNCADAEIILSKNVVASDGVISFKLNNPNLNLGSDGMLKIITYSYNLNSSNAQIKEFTKFYDMNNYVNVEFDSQSEFIILKVFPNNSESNKYITEILPVIIFNNQGQPLKNSYYLKSLFDINALSDFNNPTIDYLQAQTDIDNELKYYPNSLIAQLTKISMDKKGTENLQKICPTNTNLENLSEKELTLLYNIYNSDGKKNEAEQVSKIILKKYPLGAYSEQIFYTKLSDKKDNDYIDLAELFIRQYPNSSKKQEIIDKISQIYIERNNLQAAKALLEQNNYLPPYQALRLAFAFLEKKNDKDEAKNTFNAIISRLKNKSALMPNYNTSAFQWNQDLENYLAETYRAFGEFYLQIKEPNKAIEYFNLAKSSFIVKPMKLYENLAVAYYNSKMDAEALKITEQAFNEGYDSRVVRDINRRVYNTLYRNREYDKYFDSLSASAKAERQNQLYQKLINSDINLPVLRNKDDIMVDLSLMKKDILVIELFASWCEPCENSILSFAEINNSLKKSNNVSMIAVNTFESEKLDKKVFNNKGLEGLQVFFDDTGDFARSLGITGLPIRLFIDKYGKLRYIQSGAIGKTEDIRETKDIMELINNLQ